MGYGPNGNTAADDPEAVVLDASVALTWFLNATAEQSRYADNIAALIDRDAPACVVPGLWHIEVGSRLISWQRAKELSRIQLQDALAKLGRLTIETHHHAYDPREIVQLAQRYQLAGYDAVYIDLSQRLQLPLATLDKGMRTACVRYGVELLTV